MLERSKRALHAVLWLMVGCASDPAHVGNYESGAGGSSGSSGAGAGTTGGGGGASGMSASTGGGGGTTMVTGGASGSAQLDSGVSDGATDDASTGADGGGDASRSTGPGDWAAGDYPPDLTSPNYLELSGLAGQGDYVRQYKVHVPPSYDPNVPTPVVFCIHGLGQDALLFCVTGAEMPAKSDEGGFILVMPNGYANSWNAGTCCGAASDEQLDDVALFRAIFEEVGRHVNIDLDRVYATGLSNGGYMSYRLACEAADIFTAVAPAAAAIGINDIGGGTNPASDFTTCTPSQSVAVLDIHGTADPLIPYSLQEPTIALAATNNGCSTTTLPSTQPLSGGDTTCVSQTGCPRGLELTACTIEGGGHCWFGSPDCGTGGGDIGLAIVGANSDTMKNTDAIWDFLKRQSR